MEVESIGLAGPADQQQAGIFCRICAKLPAPIRQVVGAAGVAHHSHLHSQERTIGGGELLAPLYDWLTEGFDTADLKEAKALLDELS